MIPKNELREVISKFKKFPGLVYYKEIKKRGTFNNMNWKYQKDGNIYDFNDTLIAKVESELKLYGK